MCEAGSKLQKQSDQDGAQVAAGDQVSLGAGVCGGLVHHFVSVWHIFWSQVTTIGPEPLLTGVDTNGPWKGAPWHNLTGLGPPFKSRPPSLCEG